MHGGFMAMASTLAYIQNFVQGCYTSLVLVFIPYIAGCICKLKNMNFFACKNGSYLPCLDQVVCSNQIVHP